MYTHLASVFLGLLYAATPVLGCGSPGPSNNCTCPPVNPLQEYTISAHGITAKFIPYGARLTSLLVADRTGTPQDIVVGYDDPKQYVIDTETNHTYFGPVVGRYANRIKNGTFTLDGVTYHIPKNEKGIQSLHGGDVGYDQRNWTVTAHTDSSITFSFLDTAFEGFPGDVLTHATYAVDSVTPPGSHKPVTQLTTKLTAIALTGRTPILLSNHIYWNLNGFKKPTILTDTTLHLPLSRRYIEIDATEIPTGRILPVQDSPAGTLDFLAPKLIGKDITKATSCGTGCVGYDNAWIVDRPSPFANPSSSPETMVDILHMSSDVTGISMQLTTNQKAIQVYTCDFQNGSIPVKPSQLARNGPNPPTKVIEKYGCFVLEPEGWIDAINNPHWGQEPFQIFSPSSGPYVNWATYTFSTI